MTTVTVSTGVPIQLGYQYDDYATEVVFPASIIEPFTTTYGSGGTFAIWYRRSGDATGYPIGNPLVVFNGTTVTWTVVETDVANPGQAQVQLRYIKDEHCVMSQMFTAIVEDSVDIGTEIPEPMEQWADAIIKAGSGGQPTAVTSSSSMTNHSAIYLYMGSEGGYQYGHIYYWDGTGWNDGGAYGGGSTGSGLTEDVKQALLACFENVAWIDEDGQDYVDALELALYPPTELVSISAVYTQSGTVYDTDSLDSLKADLVVTANYDNGTSATVTDYTLSGTLTEGTSTITVSYGEKTDTFTVTVTHLPLIYNYDFKTSLTDSVGGKIATLNGNATRDSSGVHISDATSYLNAEMVPADGDVTVEIKMGEMTKNFSNAHGRLFMLSSTAGLIFRNANPASWQIYNGSAWTQLSETITDATYFSGKTLTLKVGPKASSSNPKSTMKIYDGDTLLFEWSGINTQLANSWNLGMSANAFFNMTVESIKVYAGS